MILFRWNQAPGCGDWPRVYEAGGEDDGTGSNKGDTITEMLACYLILFIFFFKILVQRVDHQLYDREHLFVSVAGRIPGYPQSGYRKIPDMRHNSGTCNKPFFKQSSENSCCLISVGRKLFKKKHLNMCSKSLLVQATIKPVFWHPAKADIQSDIRLAEKSEIRLHQN